MSSKVKRKVASVGASVLNSVAPYDHLVELKRTSCEELSRFVVDAGRFDGDVDLGTRHSLEFAQLRERVCVYEGLVRDFERNGWNK